MTLLNSADSLRLGPKSIDRVYAGSNLVWQRAEGPATPFLLVNEWEPGFATSNAFGPATTPGNLAIVRCVHRAGANSVVPTITDNGEHTWHPIGDLVDGQYRGVVAGGSGDLYMWYTIVERPTTEIGVFFADYPTAPRTIFMSEWSGNATTGVLHDYATKSNPSTSGLLPVAEVTTTVSGALVVGALGALVSNRQFELVTAHFVAGKQHMAQQTTLIAASQPDLPPGTYGPQWRLIGTASSTALITAAFRPA